MHASSPTSAESWNALATSASLTSGMWINGEWANARSGDLAPLISPRDGLPIAELPMASAAEVDVAVAGARRAFATGPWARMQPRARGEILIKWAELLECHRDEMALLIALEMGKPVTVAWEVEMRTTINLIRWYGELADKLMDESPRGRQDSVAIVSREPIGVVAAITPWNFPMTLSTFKVPAALIAGNSVVHKPASQAPLSALRAAQLATEAGIPDGVLQVITGGGAVTGAALARHMDVDTLTFTGSTDVGKELLTYSGESNAKPVWLELGGKSPNIIFPDAPDLNEAIKMAAWAITFNSGQMCTAGSRLIVHESIRDQVVAGVIDRMRELVIGDPLDPHTTFGPLASSRHRDDVMSDIAEGTTSGATLVFGSTEPRPGAGWFVDPAVFVDVDQDSRLAQHEIFGPVLSVLTFTNDDEAVSIANNTVYGLGSSIWTADLSRAHLLARRIDAGLVWVNCYEEGDSSVPFGGRKLSGHGSDKSNHGLDKFTTVKTTWMQL